MKILLDTANIEAIKKYNDIYDIAGVTSNPTIISREKGDFFEILEGIRGVIGDKQLHVQVSTMNFMEILKEAEAIVKKLGKDTYIKIPATEVGIKAMKALKEKGYGVTATAIYTIGQAMLSASVGADYVAPYFNRICNNGSDGAKVISDISSMFELHNVKTQILAASFKNTNQIMQALCAGAEAVTASPDLYTMMVESPLVDSSVDAFAKDWESVYGAKKIYEL